MMRSKTEATSVSTAPASMTYPAGPMTQPPSVPAAAEAPTAPAAAPAAAGQGKGTETEVWLVEVAKGSGGGAKSNRELLSIAIREGRGADVSYKLVHVITEVPCQLGATMAVSQVDRRFMKAYETQIFSSLISPLVSLAASNKVQVRYVPMKKDKREDGLTEAADRVSARRLYVLGRQKEVDKLALTMPGGCTVVGVWGGKVVAEAMAPQIDVFDSLDALGGLGDSSSAYGHVEIEYYDSLSEHSLTHRTTMSEKSTASSPRNNLLSPSVASTSTSTAAAATAAAAAAAGAASDYSFHSLPRANTFHASDISAAAAIAEATATPDSASSSSNSNSFHAMSLQLSPLLQLRQPKGSAVAAKGQQPERQRYQKSSPHHDSLRRPDEGQPHQLLHQTHQQQPQQQLEHWQHQQQQQRSTRSPLSKSSSAIPVSLRLEDLARSVSGVSSSRLRSPKPPTLNPNPRGKSPGAIASKEGHYPLSTLSLLSPRGARTAPNEAGPGDQLPLTPAAIGIPRELSLSSSMDSDSHSSHVTRVSGDAADSSAASATSSPAAAPAASAETAAATARQDCSLPLDLASPGAQGGQRALGKTISSLRAAQTEEAPRGGTGEGTALETDCLSRLSASSLKQQPKCAVESDPGQSCSSAHAEGQGPSKLLTADSHSLHKSTDVSTGPPSNPTERAALSGRPHTANAHRAQHHLLLDNSQQPSLDDSAHSAASHFEFTLESGSGRVPLRSASPTWWGTEAEKGVGQSGAGPAPPPHREEGQKSQSGSLGLSSSWKGFRNLLKSRKGV